MATRNEFKPFENLKNRVKEMRENIQKRRSGGKTQLIGGGKLIEKGRERVAKITEKIEARKPGILGQRTQILGTWYPGKRLVEVLTPKVEGGTPTPTTTTEKKPAGKKVPHY